jgi:pSer/pThr/pTyr-binding forkhead associated (FHA) protein
VPADPPPRAVEAASVPRRRPSRVRIGRSAPFELHVPVYVGRRPRGPRQLTADQVILIEVVSPGREVSASHVQIEQRGDEVVVTDLRSTNGTAVTLPGAPRIKLAQGESIVLPPYSRIDIGDGNVIEILPGAD